MTNILIIGDEGNMLRTALMSANLKALAMEQKAAEKFVITIDKAVHVEPYLEKLALPSPPITAGYIAPGRSRRKKGKR